jgi:predicted DNA-binding protein YlxM (UPF0122 family)
MVVDLYYNKNYTYRQIATEVRMSPNQISKIIRRHEEKNDAIANKKKVLSHSSQAYKLFSEGKDNVQVAIKLDLPQEQITQFRLEYWRLQNQDELESMYMITKGKVSVLRKIYKELMIMGGMSSEKVAAVVDINLNILPEMKRKLGDMKRELDETCKALARKQVELNILEEEEKRRRNRIFTLPSSSYYVENSPTNATPYYSAPRQPPSLSFWSSGNHDPWSEYRDKEKTKR